MSEYDKSWLKVAELAEARRKRKQPRVMNTNARFTTYLTTELRPDMESVRFGYMTKG